MTQNQIAAFGITGVLELTSLPQSFPSPCCLWVTVVVLQGPTALVFPRGCFPWSIFPITKEKKKKKRVIDTKEAQWSCKHGKTVSPFLLCYLHWHQANSQPGKESTKPLRNSLSQTAMETECFGCHNPLGMISVKKESIYPEFQPKYCKLF